MQRSYLSIDGNLKGSLFQAAGAQSVVPSLLFSGWILSVRQHDEDCFACAECEPNLQAQAIDCRFLSGPCHLLMARFQCLLRQLAPTLNV